MSTVWMICDSYGYDIANGLQGPEVSDDAADLAQALANILRHPVTLCRADLAGPEYVFRPA